jgi:hypothetical protein
VKFDNRFAPSAEILEVLKPILDPLVKRDRPKFLINRLDPFALELTTEDGFHYGVEPSRLWIDFQHRLRVKPMSGGPPVAELLSRAAPFSELLPEVSARLLEAAKQILEISTRKLMRVGIVTSTQVAQEDLPPGIKRFIDYIARPWNGLIEPYSFQITAELAKTDNWFDRCNHIVIKSDDPDQLPVLQFDWHRTFVDERTATLDLIREEIDRAARDSMTYFEDLGEGNRFDEELIRGA